MKAKELADLLLKYPESEVVVWPDWYHEKAKSMDSYDICYIPIDDVVEYWCPTSGLLCICEELNVDGVFSICI